MQQCFLEAKYLVRYVTCNYFLSAPVYLFLSPQCLLSSWYWWTVFQSGCTIGQCVQAHGESHCSTSLPHLCVHCFLSLKALWWVCSDGSLQCCFSLWRMVLNVFLHIHLFLYFFSGWMLIQIFCPFYYLLICHSKWQGPFAYVNVNNVLGIYIVDTCFQSMISKLYF